MIAGSGKPNIAIIIPGGIGTGHNNIGVPVLERIVKLLAVDFNITVLQLYKTNENYVATGFELVDVYSRYPWLKILKAVAAFWKLHRRKKFVAIHGYWILPGGFLAVLLGKLARIKSIVSVLGGDAIGIPEINYGQLLNPYYRWLSRYTLRNAGEVMALTQYLVNNLQRAGITRDAIHVVPWGIDTVLFAFHERPHQEPLRFLHIANLHPVKDQRTLLHAFAGICRETPAHLTIIGEGVLEQQLKMLANELNIAAHVTFMGLLPYEQLPQHYQKSDILLHTSLSEGQSEVVTEAMSSGVLVCGTRVGLLFDLPECCVAVPVGDYRALATETLQIIRDPERMAHTRKAAHQWTSIHSIQWTADYTKKLYATSML